jgi:hypothetical protein
MNQMLINVATRKFARSVRLPEGDVPARLGAGLTKSAVSRRFVALSAARMKEDVADASHIREFCELFKPQPWTPPSEARRPSPAGILQAARVAFNRVKHDRELWEQAGVGPGDAYLALWSHLIELRNQWHSQQKEERRDYFAERYAEVLRWLLPYERPRLAVVKVDPDAKAKIAPEEMARALAKSLTPQELELLDRVALKLVSSPSTIDAQAEPPVDKKRR